MNHLDTQVITLSWQIETRERLTVTNLIIFLLVLLPLWSWVGNDKLKITGQRDLTTTQGQPLTLSLSDLFVEGEDAEDYPNGFTLTVHPGKDYAVSGTTVTPDPGFSGKLKVEVSVSNGESESKTEKIDIAVQQENVAPVITAQRALSVESGQSLTIGFADLSVSDPDDAYPAGFTMTLSPGSNYTVSGQTVTPAPGFSGTLTVPVVVNDGEASSNEFALAISVTAANVRPTITGQTTSLTTQEDQPIAIDFGHLSVSDPDDTYPNGFTMTVSSGPNHTAEGNTVRPASGFAGTLSVPVVVNDGQASSDPFNVTINVTAKPPENVRPVITGQTAVSTVEGTPVTIELTHLTVSDPDDSYPQDFTLSVGAGSNYSVSGRTVTPAAGFSGTLTVPVTVNDGTASSDPFNFSITVTPRPPENVAPVITGHTALSTQQGVPVTIEPGHLQVTDPDDSYPQDFTLSVGAGANYSVSGTTVTPAPGFTGQLSVPVTVNDGQATSAPFNVAITVAPAPNVKPVIAGQVPLSIVNTQSLTISLNHLVVTDPDDTYPEDFTLEVLPGPNYSVSGTTITPNTGFSGVLVVKVRVSDGQQSSDPYELQITVQPAAVNVRPVITGQQELTTFKNTPITITLGNVVVTDPDNPYPQGFTLAIQPGGNYTVSGTTVTPAANFTGALSVPVTVNDGTTSSNPFNLVINVIDRGELRIIAQKSVTIAEDATYQLKTGDLTVSDPQNQWPAGFSIAAGSGENYTVNNGVIAPVRDFSGSLSVPIQVTNGSATSAPFNFIVVVTPVNDPPVFTAFDSTTVIQYVAGGQPVVLGPEIGIADPDNTELAFAEVQIGDDFAFGKDQLLMEDRPPIRGVFDPNAGTLVLIGLADLSAYQEALRSVRFASTDSSVATRTISFRLNDGQHFSETKRKRVAFAESLVLDIPSVFTPNADNANDTWNIVGAGAAGNGSAVIRVFDKRGNLVYQNTSFDTPWDGTSNGRLLPADTYYYVIDIRSSGNNLSRKGVVTLLY